GRRYDHIRLRPHHVASQLGIAFGVPFSGVPVHDEVFPFDITKPAQLPQERSRNWICRLRYEGNGHGWRNYSDAVYLRRLLGLRMRHTGRDQQTGYELPPFHSITSSAISRKSREIVRPSALAVFRLITNSNFVDYCTVNSAGLAPFRIFSK